MTDTQAVAALTVALGEVYSGATPVEAAALADQLDNLGYTLTDTKQDR